MTPDDPGTAPDADDASHEQPEHDGTGAAPETGDLLVDGATRDLAATDPADLDAVADAGDGVHTTLQARLRDLDG